MALAIYYIMRGEDQWIIRFDDRDYGHNSLTSAMKAALAAARSSSEQGHEVQVLVQWPDGAWVVTWTSEDDFTPAGGALGSERGRKAEASAAPATPSVSERPGSITATSTQGPGQA